MTITKSSSLVRHVRQHIAGGYLKKQTIPPPQAKFERLGTIFSRTTGLIKSGVFTKNEIPLWYSIYKTFPPKYEPKFKRPPLDVDVKEIYFVEDKIRAANRRWATLDMASPSPNTNQLIVATFRARRTTSSEDDALIKELLESSQTGKMTGKKTEKKVRNELLELFTDE